MAIYDKPQATVDWDETLGAVILRWKGFAIDEMLREPMEKALELVVSKNALKFFGDTTKLRILKPEDQEWINTNWIPRINQAGVKWVAIVMPSSEYARATVRESNNNVQSTPHGVFVEIRPFEQLEEAQKWLKDKK
jgi:hypothetical protein